MAFAVPHTFEDKVRRIVDTEDFSTALGLMGLTFRKKERKGFLTLVRLFNYLMYTNQYGHFYLKDKIIPIKNSV